jgi:hypothetical protein
MRGGHPGGKQYSGRALLPPSIVFYKSSFCPRCLLAGRILDKLRMEYGNLEVEEIDVVVHPLLVWNAGIRMIPAIRAGDVVLAGVFLKEDEIRRFVVSYLASLGPESRKVA